MSPPIHFKGADYDSVEAMPPDIRASYEQSQRDKARLQHSLEQARQGAEQARRGLDEVQRGESAAEPLTPAPAWGGAHGPLPVPVEFEPVTGLGPAARVHEHDGIRIFPNFGPPRPNVTVRYRDGFAFRVHKDLHTWRWDEVAVIQSNVSRHMGEHISWTDYEYTLTKHNGEQVILDDGLKDIEKLIGPIKEAVFALIGPPLAQRYKAGEALMFGPVTIHRHQGGLQLNATAYEWEAIQDIKLESGRFKITLPDGKKHEVRASALPNIELLCQLIGLKMWEGNLEYY